MSQVTRKMFFEEYVRQHINHNGKYTNMDTLVARMVNLNRRIDGDTNWDYTFMATSVFIATCKKLGLVVPEAPHYVPICAASPYLEVLRRLPKE